MTLPAFVPSIDQTVHAAISAKLDEIERDHDVRILFAVESGSRAWGFPSPDSDYDARFVYVNRRDWYLSLTPGRDVIELPISDELDIAGWDLRKALNLLLKPNPVMLEWLSGPIRYRWNEPACTALHGLAERITHQIACRYHYLSLGEGQWRKHVGDAEEVNFKKYFYILRPALALRWLRLQPDRLPPMNLQALIEGLDLDRETTGRIADLLEAKAMAKEIGTGARIAEIDHLIQSEFELARTATEDPARGDHRDAATALFRRLVEGD
ncbi:nucleotidyltransferase domain-containing protein [Defluviimonas salinarum]|uniref:Nucleotidyltransferase domain-containing protein n=1 Tax=Defluviimonas salinarum TaxID=2992147 RepID=A0ABT3J2B3_9RHOB|nr:nucleotidyltransferase domain-containing protein [Defluviimonas salinarum]MCW3781554.1 nucleotidyltransferase domain-containing protein [Defluviimonas salinarum]